MVEVKWIKISTNMFDDEKIKLIRKLPEGNGILLVWIHLLVLAGKCNATGYIYLAENIPYTDEMLATVMDMPVNIIRLALETFQRLKMIEIDEEHFIYIENWEKHQNIDGLEKIREQNRLRKQRQRARQKALEEGKENSHVTSRDSHATDIEEEGEEDIDIDIEEDIEREETKEPPVPYEKIKELYNSICKDLSQVRSVSSTRKTHLQARWKQFKYNIETFEKVFEKVQASNFCTGQNQRGWKADFDWLIKNDNNMVKVLEGKYDNEDGGEIDGSAAGDSRKDFKFDKSKFLWNGGENSI